MGGLDLVVLFSTILVSSLLTFDVGTIYLQRASK